MLSTRRLLQAATLGNCITDRQVLSITSREQAGYKQVLYMQVKAVLCAALFPNVAVMDDSGGKSGRPAWNDGTGEVFIHPSSINHGLNAPQFQRPYLTFLEKVIVLIIPAMRQFAAVCNVVLVWACMPLQPEGGGREWFVCLRRACLSTPSKSAGQDQPDLHT